jgi:hypothetical protein
MKIKNYIWLVVFLTFLFSSCTKSYQKQVSYIATGASSAYNLQYLNDQNTLIKTTVEPNSAVETWKYDFMADEGDIVYVSGNYKDINSALKIQVLVDGKVYKQGATQGDTLKYLVVSGVVPYD